MKIFKGSLLLFLIVNLCSCNFHNSDLYDKFDQTFKQYESEINHKRILTHQLQLDSLTDFEWEKVYIFIADTGFPNETISRTTGIKFKGKSLPDNWTRLVFVKEGKIASFVDFNPEKRWVFFHGGYYSRVKGDGHIPQFFKQDVCFLIIKSCKRDVWYFIPKNELENFKRLIEKHLCLTKTIS